MNNEKSYIDYLLECAVREKIMINLKLEEIDFESLTYIKKKETIPNGDRARKEVLKTMLNSLDIFTKGGDES